jgi:hypothetical protein
MTLALTIALAVTIATPALVGYWREPRRGLLALGGTLLGATLASFWAARWGQDMARALGGSPATPTLFISLGLLLAGALLIGYGGGVLLPAAGTRLTLPRRLLGMLLGLLNGVLLAGYALRYAAEASPGFAEELIGVPLAELVRDGLPLLFLGLALVLALLILARRVVLLVRRPATATQPQAAVGAPATAGKEVQRKAAEKIEAQTNKGAP